jgi:hypothetical protein
MEIAQGNSVCRYLYLKEAKMSFSHVVFSLLSSTKSENRRAEQVLPRGKGQHRWKGRGNGEKG